MPAHDIETDQRKERVKTGAGESAAGPFRGRRDDAVQNLIGIAVEWLIFTQARDDLERTREQRPRREEGVETDGVDRGDVDHHC